ncbi:hypothetical protein [Pseudooceanicola sp.]|uniref:hypothetical protein n=1 Tax=Pseudooceanicola sp. TaxID=1914328 RepID=UPI0035C7102D
MTELKSTTHSIPSSQEVCELEIWSPPQGSLKEAVPISIDLDFFAEQVALPNFTFIASAKRATLYVRIDNANIARGSRLGEYPLDPEMVAEVTQSVRTAIENAVDTSGSMEVGVRPGFFGKLTGIVKWTKRKSKKYERDQIVKTAARIARISPRPKLKWDVVEPISPYLLKGRYIGSSGEKEVGPLFLLTMEKNSCIVEVCVAIQRQDVVVSNLVIGGAYINSTNKKAVLDQLARRSIEGSQLASGGASIHTDPESILLCSSKMEIEIENK